MRSLKPRERSLLALTLLVVVLAGTVMLALTLRNQLYARYDQAIAASLDQIARYERIGAARGDYEQAIKMVKSKDVARYYLKSSTPALAATDIQQVVQTLAEANAMRIDSLQISPHKDLDGLRRQITINLRLRGDRRGLQNMLYALESTQPYLFVDNLNLQATARSEYVPIPGVNPTVIAQFDVSGFALLKLKKTDPVKASNAALRH